MAFRAVTLLHSGTTNQVSSISGTVPGSAVAGDVLLIAAMQGSGTNTLSVSGLATTPALVSGPQIVNSNVDVWVWAVRLDAADLGDTVTVTSTGGGYFAGVLHAFSGDQMTGLQVAVTKVTTAATSLVTPSLTTTVANCDIVTLWALRSASATTPVVTVPGTQTKDGAATTGASAASPSFSLTASHRTTVGAAGAYGGSTGTANTASTGVLFTVSLQPAAVAGADGGFKVYKVSSGGVDQRVSIYYVDGTTDVQVSDRTS